MSEVTNLGQLRRMITSEILSAFGLPPGMWVRKAVAPVFWLPAYLFAKLIANLDTITAQEGLKSAASKLLPRFTDNILVSGGDHVPANGPLLIASNHPGAYDGVAILSNIPRDDIKVIISDVPFIRNLPSISRYMIYTPDSIQSRMTAIRALIRHLNNGGAGLIFPSGKVDPDPALLPGASEGLDAWSPSLALILKQVPQTKLLISIVSGVLAPSNLNSPFLRFVNEPWRKLKLAEFIQVIQQLVFKQDFGLQPKLSFDEPLTAAELIATAGVSGLQQAITLRARKLLEYHLSTVFIPAVDPQATH